MIDATTFAEAYEKGIGPTTRFLGRRGAKDAEEFAQAAWARAWEYRHQLHDPGAIAFWVKSIAVNLYRASFRNAACQIEEYGPDLGYRDPLESSIEARQVLALCKPDDARLLWNRYAMGEGGHGSPVSRTGRVYLHRACNRARLAVQGKVA